MLVYPLKYIIIIVIIIIILNVAIADGMEKIRIPSYHCRQPFSAATLRPIVSPVNHLISRLKWENTKLEMNETEEKKSSQTHINVVDVTQIFHHFYFTSSNSRSLRFALVSAKMG